MLNIVEYLLLSIFFAISIQGLVYQLILFVVAVWCGLNQKRENTTVFLFTFASITCIAATAYWIVISPYIDEYRTWHLVKPPFFFPQEIFMRGFVFTTSRLDALVIMIMVAIPATIIGMYAGMRVRKYLDSRHPQFAEKYNQINTSAKSSGMQFAQLVLTALAVIGVFFICFLMYMGWVGPYEAYTTSTLYAALNKEIYTEIPRIITYTVLLFPCFYLLANFITGAHFKLAKKYIILAALFSLGMGATNSYRIIQRGITSWDTLNQSIQNVENLAIQSYERRTFAGNIFGGVSTYEIHFRISANSLQDAQQSIAEHCRQIGYTKVQSNDPYQMQFVNNLSNKPIFVNMADFTSTVYPGSVILYP